MKIIKITYIGIVILLISSTSQAHDWYFDKDSIGGTCSDTGPGTITQPFCNIFNKLWNQSWNVAAAGDTIYIRQGTYTGRLFWIKPAALTNGTPENPITIRPYPGETVVFDGLGTADKLFNLYGQTHDLHFIGPFEAKNYSIILDGDIVTSLRTNLIFDGWTIHNVSMGFLLRFVKDTTVKNSTFYDLKGLPTAIADNVIGVSVRGNATLHSDNVTIENCVAHDVNDGKGNDNGDADGFHTDQYCDRATFKNLQAYRCSEDGVDTKAQTVIMENITTYHNGATGIKMWGGGQGRISNYTASNLLSYGNTETGLKCTGYQDTVSAVIDHITSWGNGEENIKNTAGDDLSNPCNLTVRNSIIGEGGINAIMFPVPIKPYSTKLHLIKTNITHSGSAQTISPGSCPTLSGKYSTTEYTSGIFNTDMAAGVDCGSYYGTMSGSAVNPTSFNPQLIDPSPVFEWASIATAAITSNTLTLVAEASYPWPAPVVGHYIEIDDDGIKRQITAVGNATTRTITFTPAVSSQICGRVTDCRGVRVIGWATGTTHTNDMSLASDSPAIDAGLLVSGKHCAQSDDNGGSGLSGCIHWNGTAPDLGFKEFGLLQSSSLPQPQMKKASPH
jgi:hypothetical protein